MTILLVRHAESAANVDPNSLKDTADWALPLTAKGVRQATDAGKFLHDFYDANPPESAVRFWVSPYKRTMHTAELIRAEVNNITWDKAARGQDLHIDERLRERDWGFMLHHRAPNEDPDMRDRFPHQVNHINHHLSQPNGLYYTRPYGGENIPDVALRLRSFYKDLYFDILNGKKDHVIVMHGMALWVFLMTFLKLSPDHMSHFTTIANTGMRLLSHDPQINKYADYGTIYDPDKGVKILEKPKQPIDWWNAATPL